MAGSFGDEEMVALATAFPPGPAAREILARAGYPAAALPSMVGVAGLQFWSQINDDVTNGIIDGGRARILNAALRAYPHNPIFRRAANLLRVLVVGAGLATAAAGAAIRADRESRLILQAKELGHLEVELRPAATVDDLTFNPARPPDVLHLICHGDGRTLLFADELGDPRRVPAADVADLIAAYRVRLRGIVLNACRSEECADAFSPLADTVIAHRGAVDDGCAQLFAAWFYRTLRDHPDLADAARIAAKHLAVGEARCPEVNAGLVVLTGGTPANDPLTNDTGR
ncbi:MAG TPA: effector-associated domain EAD1-containing protein [Actinocrinis sp.]